MLGLSFLASVFVSWLGRRHLQDACKTETQLSQRKMNPDIKRFDVAARYSEAAVFKGVVYLLADQR